MENEYEVVGKFLSPSKITGEMVRMVVVRDERGACTMPEDEWKRVYADSIEKDGKRMIRLRK